MNHQYDAEDRLLFVGIAADRVDAEQRGDDVRIHHGWFWCWTLLAELLLEFA
jgi:hypothetical protein